MVARSAVTRQVGVRISQPTLCYTVIMITRILYWPGDTLSHSLTRRQRIALATWTLILVIATIPIRYLWKDAVWMVWVISEFALVLALWGVVAAETPVESEQADMAE
jgi:hypothetical protein